MTICMHECFRMNGHKHWQNISQKIKQLRVQYQIKFNICSDGILEWIVTVTVFMCSHTTCMCHKRRWGKLIKTKKISPKSCKCYYNNLSALHYIFT